ncbi:WD40 repeat-like protein [Suillus weaverae]|nr:WD40 repeat-like protein [Suillus weaverae]
MNHRHVSFISYFPDSKGMVSASFDKTIRRWDLRAGKEIEEAREVHEQETWAMAVSRDGRWVVTSSRHTSGQDTLRGELKARDVETRVMKAFECHSRPIYWIVMSGDSTLLAGELRDGRNFAVWIWSLESGKLVACLNPMGRGSLLGAGRFSQDSKKFARLSKTGRCLEVWDVQTQKLDVKVEESCCGTMTNTPIFWTTKDKSIVAVFDFKDLKELESESESGWPPRDLNTIYEFDALTLELVGAPFTGHTHTIYGLALSFDCALLASASRHDNTVKLWAFESRQLLASFDDRRVDLFIFSPNSYQLACTHWGDTNIYIYDIPHDITWPVKEAQLYTTKKSDLLNLHQSSQSDATRRAARRNPATFPIPKPPPTIHPEQRLIRYLRKLLSSRTNAGPRDPLDFPATSPLPPNRSPSAQVITQRRSDTDSRENSRSTSAPLITQLPATTTFKVRLHHLSTWRPVRAGHASPPIVIVPHAQAKERNAAAGAPRRNEDLIPDEDHVPSRPPSPNPDSQQPPAAAQITTEEHGSGRLCGCF